MSFNNLAVVEGQKAVQIQYPVGFMLNQLAHAPHMNKRSRTNAKGNGKVDWVTKTKQ